MAGSFLLLSLGVRGSGGGPEPSEEAHTLLQRYFSALQTGNVAVLGNVLGGELRASRAGLLQNPDYALDLVQSYSTSAFDIIELQVLESGDVVATVDTWLDASERIRHRLTIRRAVGSDGYLIVDSEIVP